MLFRSGYVQYTYRSCCVSSGSSSDLATNVFFRPLWQTGRCWGKVKNPSKNLHVLGDWRNTVTSDFVRNITSATGNLTFPLWKDIFSSEDDSNDSSNWTSETLLAWHSSTLGLPFILWFACSSAWTPLRDNRHLENALLLSRLIYVISYVIEMMLHLGLDSLHNQE